MELGILSQFEMKIKTKDKRSKGTRGMGGGKENKTKTGSGRLRDFPWEGWEACPDIKRRRKKKGTSESSGSHLRCWETGFSAGTSLMEAWPRIKITDGKPGPLDSALAHPWQGTRSPAAFVFLF